MEIIVSERGANHIILWTDDRVALGIVRLGAGWNGELVDVFMWRVNDGNVKCSVNGEIIYDDSTLQGVVEDVITRDKSRIYGSDGENTIPLALFGAYMLAIEIVENLVNTYKWNNGEG